MTDEKTYQTVEPETWWQRNFGLPRPVSATATGWVHWRRDMKKDFPIRYFLSETLPNFFRFKVRMRITYPFRRLRSYYVSHFVRQHHIVKIHSLGPGWHDTDARIFHSAFDLLTDFVEQEKASMMLHNDEEIKKLGIKVPRTRWGHRNWRSRELGLMYLDWEIALNDKKSPHYQPHCASQAKAAKEIKQLYLWYKDIRPKRYDAHSDDDPLYAEYRRVQDASKLSDDDSAMSDFMFLDLPHDHPVRQAFSAWSGEVNNLEEAYEAEDDKMLIRLVRVRHNLWT
jgi:hypothetical protein